MLHLASFSSELSNSQGEKDNMVPKSLCYLRGEQVESQGVWPVSTVLGG